MNCFELFAGCGGLGNKYGFHQEGFNIIGCNELDSSIAETYKENFTNTNVIVGDITKQSIKTDIYSNFKDSPCDIILGGPPCVAYSMSGHRDSRDPRGQLFKEYIEVVKTLQPKVFILENVKGILTILHDKPKLTKKEKTIADKYYELEAEKINIIAKKKILSSKTEENMEGYNEIVKDTKTSLKDVNSKLKKMGKDIHIFRMKVTDIIKNTFEEIGYNVDMKLMNAADYGVPQKRERVIFIGVRKDIKQQITFPREYA